MFNILFFHIFPAILKMLGKCQNAIGEGTPLTVKQSLNKTIARTLLRRWNITDGRSSATKHSGQIYSNLFWLNGLIFLISKQAYNYNYNYNQEAAGSVYYPDYGYASTGQHAEPSQLGQYLFSQDRTGGLEAFITAPLVVTAFIAALFGGEKIVKMVKSS